MSDELLQIINGDALESLRGLPAGGVQCCVTSPPYLGLRDYKVAGQIGLESTPDAYVDKLVEVFREVRRILKNDGVLFLNLGDSYSSAEYGNIREDEKERFFKLPLEIRHELFRLWASAGRAAMQGPLFDLLSQEMEGVTSRGDKESFQNLLSKQQEAFPNSDCGTQQEAQSRNDPDTRRAVCLLRGKGNDVSLFGSYQGTGAQGIPEDRWHGGYLETGNQGRITEGQIQSSLLELQCRAWSIWSVSSLKLNLAYIPRQARSLFTVTLKPKDCLGIPWLVAFALRADGWYLRSEIIWCLSGGTWVYARTQKGDMPMMIRDLARLKPGTVQLWNGEKWTRLLGVSRTSRNANEIELVLRSGERISCTPTHQFPTDRGLLRASEIKIGDKLSRVQLPEPEQPLSPAHITEDAAWFAGLYIAEGSRSGDTIQIAGHVKEVERWERLQRIAADYGGRITRTVDGNKMDIRLYGKFLNAIIDHLVTGKTAKDKGAAPVFWRFSNRHLEALLDGYLAGDGHRDEGNNRWRIGFTRNYNLERDLRTICARLSFRLTLNLSSASFDGRSFPAFRGEIRKERNGHHNEKDLAEVIEIRKSRCREVYDLGVEDNPHLFALASGILTHNSKPNPMPESVTDRPTKAHEQIFLLAKSGKYFYNAEAIAERSLQPVGIPSYVAQHKQAKLSQNQTGTLGTNQGRDTRNRRSVWSIATNPYPDAHFATFPPALVTPCILAGSKPGDVILDPFAGSGTTGKVAIELGRKAVLIELNPEYVTLIEQRCTTNIGLPFE